MKLNLLNLPVNLKVVLIFVLMTGSLAGFLFFEMTQNKESRLSSCSGEAQFLSVTLFQDIQPDWTSSQYDSLLKKNAEMIRGRRLASSLRMAALRLPDTTFFIPASPHCLVSQINLAAISGDSLKSFSCSHKSTDSSFFLVKSPLNDKAQLYTVYATKKINLLPYLLLYLALCALFILAISCRISGIETVSNYLREIIQSVERIREKDFDTRLSDEYPGELGALAGAIDRMRIQMKEVFQDLELRIIRRTSGISMRNAELRRTQREILKQNNELKLAYEALKESRDKYENLIEHLEDEYFFYSKAINGTLLFVSPSVSRILGYEVKHYRDIHNNIYTQNPLNDIARQYEEKLREGIQLPKYLKEVLDSNNQEKILEVSEVPVLNEHGQLVSVEGLARDITEQKKAEELITEQEEKYRMLFTHASDFIMMYEIDKKRKRVGKFIEVNRYAMDRLGYSLDELRNMTPMDLIAIEVWHEDSKNSGLEELATQEATFERIWESKDAQILDVEISAHSFKIRNKEVAIAVARDITERKRAEEEIRFVNEELVNQKENLEALVDNLTQTQEQLVQSEKMAALGQLIAGIAHEINTPLGAIKASIGNLGDSLNNALGELPSLFQTQSADNLHLFTRIFELSRTKKQELSSREKRQKRKELSVLLAENKIENAELLADSLVYLEIYADSLDEILPLFKKQDALQVVRSAKNFISLLKNTNTINIAVEKATKVVFALKKYAHRDTMGEKTATDIHDSIETVLTLYNNQLKQGIEVVKEWEQLPPVMCYQDEISQVWTNLIQNAIQAMHLEGTLTIKTHLHNDSVFVSFNDTGIGIEPDLIDKIFDPFFTTKKQGEGSGLGLDIVKKIIEKHNGSIAVESELGLGAKFTIKLPLE